LVVIGLVALGVFAIPLAAHGINEVLGGPYDTCHDGNGETWDEWHDQHHGLEDANAHDTWDHGHHHH
jgi:hypothetical protein